MLMGLIVLVLHLCKIKSITVPYLTPIAPKIKGGNKDTIFRFPLWKMKYRPVGISGTDAARAGGGNPVNSSQKKNRNSGDYMKLKRLLFILIILSTIFLTGCWSSREINTLAIAVCIGIDKTENGYLVTKQVLNPRAIATKVTAESPVVIYTAEGDDLAEIVRRFTTQSSRIFYNADLRMVVFGEDVAKDGIQNILDYFYAITNIVLIFIL